MASSLDDLVITTANFGTITIPSTMYLQNTDSGDCACLISEADSLEDYYAVLGAAFFRDVTIQFDFEKLSINMWSKTTDSPIVASVTTDSDKLSTGAIVGISIGSVIFLALILFCISYCCCCRGKKESATASHYSGINEGVDAEDE